MISVCKDLIQFELLRKKITSRNIGLVPTMGNLHLGHLSLIEKSLKDNDITIISIFVNPIQFAPNEDFEKYPRTLERDLELIRQLHAKNFCEKKVIVFSPKKIKDVFSKGFDTTISIGGPLTKKLCGEFRPQHFAGVTTVVYRLFSITKPKVSYFGQKDYQQFQIIKKMVDDLDIDIKLTMMPIIRDSAGLALSSRNQYLKNEDKDHALDLPTTLIQIEKEFHQLGFQKAIDKFSFLKEDKINDQSWQYLEILDSETLDLASEKSEKILLAGAKYVGKTRLIDNRIVAVSHV